MWGTSSHRAACAALAAAALLLRRYRAAAPSTRVRGKEGASSELEARNVKPEDPLARPIQVAWTSARAVKCGFVFSPEQLRANFLSAEAQAGNTPGQMQKIEQAYDYTLNSMTATIKDDLSYCNKERTAAIRTDLNRYLAGDYTPSARMAQ